MRVMDLAATVALLAAAFPGPARAFSAPDRFAEDAMTGGGGGRWFTGAPGDGLTCAVCHEGGQVQLRVSGIAEQGFSLGRSQELRLTWPSTTTRAALTFEVVGADGRPSGELRPMEEQALEDNERCADGRPATRAISVDETRTVLAVEACGAEVARARWVPSASQAWFHASAVLANADGRFTGDQTGSLAEAFHAEGSPDSELAVLDAGCSARRGGERDGARAATLLLLLTLPLIRRRPAH